MSHHDHSQSHPQNYNQAFSIGIVLNLIYIVVEVFFGIIINSMALLADAGHNFSDVLGLLLAWGATYLAKTATTEKRTYGLRKSTILAAFFNGIILMIAVGAITIEAIRKFISPEPVQGSTMIIVAAVGVIINSVTAFLFISGRKEDLNIKAAFLHLAADAAVSLGVVVGGFFIMKTNWLWIDPTISLVIVLVITLGTWNLLKDSFQLSIDAVPKEINLKAVENYLRSLNGVNGVHDLHIWGMSTTESALSVHLEMEKYPSDNLFIEQIKNKLHDNFGIEHPTIQFELFSKTNNCGNCS
jgi:cobalt-zinc-cadmium efflux system protein